jgi:hypothetical protein
MIGSNTTEVAISPAKPPFFLDTLFFRFFSQLFQGNLYNMALIVIAAAFNLLLHPLVQVFRDCSENPHSHTPLFVMVALFSIMHILQLLKLSQLLKCNFHNNCNLQLTLGEESRVALKLSRGRPKAIYDVIADILEASQGGVGRNQLRKAIGVSRTTLKVYLDFCRKHGLLTGDLFLHTTLKGQNYLQLYDRVMKMLDDSVRMWRQRREWLKQRIMETSGREREEWERMFKQSESFRKKRRSERVLELLIAMSEQQTITVVQ